MRIDTHCHFIPKQYVEQDASMPASTYAVRIADGSGRVLQSLAARDVPGGDAEQVYSLERRVRDMDRLGVDVHVLSISPWLFAYHLDPATMVAVCRLLNDAFAAEIARRPDRFVALAHVPMQDAGAAAAELERCVRDLGFRGAEICSHINGANLDDPALAPFYRKAQELDVPVFIHPQQVLGADRLSRYHLANLIGNPTDTAVAAASLIFGGVLQEFPRLQFYLAHGGGTCPLLRGRWEHGWRVRPEAKQHIKRPPSEFFQRFMFDSLTHSGEALDYLVRAVGAERVMLGSDYPADMADPDPVKSIQSVPSLTDPERQRILGDNAAELFKIG